MNLHPPVLQRCFSRESSKGVLSVWPSCPRVPSSYFLFFPPEGHRGWYVWPDGIFPLYFPGLAHDIKFHCLLSPSLSPSLLFAWRSRTLYFTWTFVLDLLCLSIRPFLRLCLARFATSKDIQFSVVSCSLLWAERKTRQIRKTKSREEYTTTLLPE